MNANNETSVLYMVISKPNTLGYGITVRGEAYGAYSYGIFPNKEKALRFQKDKGIADITEIKPY